MSSDATETPEHNFCPTQYYVLEVIKIMSFRKLSNYRKKGMETLRGTETGCPSAKMPGKNNNLFLASSSKT